MAIAGMILNGAYVPNNSISRADMEITPQVAVAICIAVIGGFWALAKLLMMQTFKQLDERFATQDTARTKAQEHWDMRFAQQDSARSKVQEHWDQRFAQIESLARSTDKDLLMMRGDLPNLYLRREDYIRGQSTIEAKLDAIATELKMVQIKGSKV